MNTLKTEDWSAWPAPAKLNLFLNVTGKRADGYHTLQTLFRFLRWGDTVWLRPRQDGSINRIGNYCYVDKPENDLAVRAARLLKHYTRSCRGADICIEKVIPVGGGFGGGSSDAATVLVALNAIWNTCLDTDTLAYLGGEIGADIPVFVHGHNAWAEGIGDELSFITLPESAYLVIDSQVHVATSTIFCAVELTSEPTLVTIEQYRAGATFGNVFEPIVRHREPTIDAVFHTLSAIGSPHLTGSGGGVFVEFDSLARAKQAQKQLVIPHPTWVTIGAEYSPLLDALEAYASRKIGA